MEKFLDLRYSIKTALQKLKIYPNRIPEFFMPHRPLLIEIAMTPSEGCSFYSKILSKKATLKNQIFKRETKWHHELNTTFSIQFWSNVRHLYTSIRYDNQLLWLQLQIVRNSLQTNSIE